jgi:hypothetical protein
MRRSQSLVAGKGYRVYMLLTILKSFYAVNDLTLSYLVLIQ